MKDLQLHATHLKDTEWLIELYNPNIGAVEIEDTKTFDTSGAARVWAETLGTVENVFDEGDTIWVSVPANEQENTQLMFAL